MSKETDNINLEAPIEKAIDAMEPSTDITDEQLQEILWDKESRQAAQDILDTQFFLHTGKRNMQLNVEAELARFKKRHQKQKIHTFWKTSISIAASIVLCIGMYHYISQQQETTNTAPVIVFTADNSPQQVILDKGDGKKIVLAEHQANTPQKTQSTPKELSYSSKPKDVILHTHTLTVPRGETFKITLCDGTEVWLNANTHFVYPTAFIGKERIVTLKGEAYFKVAKDTEHPFIVKTPHVQTRVLGTEFNIRSYSPEDTHIVLISGKVEVSNTKDNAYTPLIPGEDAHLQPDGRFIMTEVDLDSYIYWKDGFFYFDDITLKDIMENIGRWYNVNIEFRNPDAMKYKMHFVSDRTKQLEHTLKLLNQMKKATATIRNNTIVID